MTQAAPPPVRIAPFAGDRAAAISYTFDDGLRDQVTLAVPMLDEVGFKGTFFVIPSTVSATVEEAEKKQDLKRAWGSVTWDELRKIAAQGHEIGSHTWDHRGLTKIKPEDVEPEFTRSYDAIKTQIGRPPLTLAFPFNQSTPEIETVALKHYVACRDGQLGVGGKSTAEQLDKWADQQVEDRKWGVVMAHAIGKGYAAFSDPEILRKHLHYVKGRQDDIWVDTFANVVRYVKERVDATLTVASRALSTELWTPRSTTCRSPSSSRLPAPPPPGRNAPSTHCPPVFPAAPSWSTPLRPKIRSPSPGAERKSSGHYACGGILSGRT